MFPAFPPAPLFRALRQMRGACRGANHRSLTVPKLRDGVVARAAKITSIVFFTGASGHAGVAMGALEVPIAIVSGR